MNCDFIAPWYRWLEYLTFGGALQRRRAAYLQEIQNATRVLVLGDGDGRFTAEFLKRNTGACVDFVDSSAGMARLAEERIERTGVNGGRMRWLVADVRELQLKERYDLVVTHFFLDCFSSQEVAELVARVADAVGARARWVVSEFQVPPSGMWRVAGRVLIRMLYFAFRLLTGLQTSGLPQYTAALEAGGFERCRREEAVGGLLVSELWEKRALRGRGVGRVSLERNR